LKSYKIQSHKTSRSLDSTFLAAAATDNDEIEDEIKNRNPSPLHRYINSLKENIENQKKKVYTTTKNYNRPKHYEKLQH
jgi:plasmid stabilization system protein ParE